MQNETVLRKWSDVKGVAAITINTGSKVGVIEDFLFDPQTNRILALLIKTSLFGHRVLLASAINAVGVDAVTFATEDVLVKENDQQVPEPALLGHSLMAYRVLSQGGTLVGTIGNIILDVTTPTTIHIATFELSGGLRERFSGRYNSFDANQLVSYGQDVLVIPDTIAQTLSNS